MSGASAGSNDELIGRLVVTGHDEANRSTIVSSGAFPTQVRRRNGLTIVDAWTADVVPTSMDATSAASHDESLKPPTSGVCIRIAVFPPDANVDAADAAAYAAEAEGLYGDQGTGAGPRPGMHRTETVDVVTVLSGEIWNVTDDGEVLLSPGDVLVQRGTAHAWSNRSNLPCTVVTTMIPAIRP
ncbi:MAG: cupin domain-containing protein [Actinomycetales bacterium]